MAFFDFGQPDEPKQFDAVGFSRDFVARSPLRGFKQDLIDAGLHALGVPAGFTIADPTGLKRFEQGLVDKAVNYFFPAAPAAQKAEMGDPTAALSPPSATQSAAQQGATLAPGDAGQALKSAKAPGSPGTQTDVTTPATTTAAAPQTADLASQTTGQQGGSAAQALGQALGVIGAVKTAKALLANSPHRQAGAGRSAASAGQKSDFAAAAQEQGKTLGRILATAVLKATPPSPSQGKTNRDAERQRPQGSFDINVRNFGFA